MESMAFPSRRSVVHSVKGVAASTQPLASAVGVRILEQGGNAAMACVGMAAAMGVLEPQMTGIGGDAFALYYDGKTKAIKGVNGSGKAPAKMSVDFLRDVAGIQGARIPGNSVHAVTVPGAIAAWDDIVQQWGNGKMTLEQILAPAVSLARDGVVVSSISRNMWENGVTKLLKASPNGHELLAGPNHDRAPLEGELFCNEYMARVLETVGQEGKDGFYKGPIAEEIINVLQEKGSIMTLDDLAAHTTKFVDPVKMEVDAGANRHEDKDPLFLHELPPNGQGLVALIAVGIINQLQKQGKVDLAKMKHNSTEYLHLLIECLKFAFKDAEEFVTDVEHLDYDVNDLLSESYLSERAKLFSADKVNTAFESGVLNPTRKSDTSYFTATDSEGNACSFIASLYMGFGSGIVPKGCGFALQNRGCNFNLTPGTRNCIAGGKRPYHTIIPALATRKNDDSLYCTYGVMGGFMQPQGHMQVLYNMKVFGYDAQQALDSPRLCLTVDDKGPDSGRGSTSPVSGHTIVALEEGISPEVVSQLEKMGHRVQLVTGPGKGLFGRGQIIQSLVSHGKTVYSAGSDPRGDGMAIPQI